MNGSERYQEASTCLLSPDGLDEKFKPNMAKNSGSHTHDGMRIHPRVSRASYRRRPG